MLSISHVPAATLCTLTYLQPQLQSYVTARKDPAYSNHSQVPNKHATLYHALLTQTIPGRVQVPFVVKFSICMCHMLFTM